MSEKRSIVKWTDEQHKALTEAADALGQSVPQFTKTAALEKARKVNAE